MKWHDNDVASLCFHNSSDLNNSIAKLCSLIRNDHSVLEPFHDMNESIQKVFAKEGFQLYSTVKKTTLFYDPSTECYFKILHPLNLKTRFSFLMKDTVRSIYDRLENLRTNGIKTVKVIAYGSIKRGSKLLFVLERAEGASLYDTLIREKKEVTMSEYMKVIDQVAKLHAMGFWLADSHLSHFFIKDNEVSGIIDIEGIRKNMPFMLKNLAKDLAGLNHPELPLDKDKKMALLEHYLKTNEVKNASRFLNLIKHYSERRWKD